MSDAKREANLKLVRRVYEEILTPVNADAVDGVMAPGYIQHNPNAASGAQGLKDAMTRARARFSTVEHRVKRMFADGDHVIAHVHVIFEPGSRGLAVVDIFRIEGDRIVEHWDVAQPVPESAENENTMF